MLLYINACARDDSRTEALASPLVQRLGSGSHTELSLYGEALRPLTKEGLQKREALLAAGVLGAPEFSYARQFADADEIVIAAPYWDLSFPSVLKLYIENIYISGIVSRYDEMGRPQGLCRARRLWYVTTAGGPYDATFSFGYISALCRDFFGISDVRLVCVENLDIVGVDAGEVLRKKHRELMDTPIEPIIAPA